MDKEKLKCIIFDMDGVVLDSEPLHEETRQIMFRKYGIVKGEAFPEPVGKSGYEYWSEVEELCHMGLDPGEMEKEHYTLVGKLVEDHKLPASDGLEEVIRWAKANGVKVGLASSSIWILVEPALRHLGIIDQFDVIVSGDDVKERKPAPECYLKVLERAGAAASEAVAVEDSRTGIIAAKRAGLFCFGYKNPTSGQQNLERADVIIENLREIIQ